ncbi:ATP-binding protein [Actinomadura nitritigenes]|uniref:ATP-binding protein n=1 Tax=Actinomadura nitritigenes TaxID=134602 RepID=UPI003D94F5F4
MRDMRFVTLGVLIMADCHREAKEVSTASQGWCPMSPTSFASEVPTLVLEPDDRAPGLARRFLAEWFREWGSRDDYIGRVLVSELVTNSCVHGEGPVVVRVFRDERDGGAVIEVWECATRRSVVSPAQPGEDWRFSLGLMAYPDPKGKRGK